MFKLLIHGAHSGYFNQEIKTCYSFFDKIKAEERCTQKLSIFT